MLTSRSNGGALVTSRPGAGSARGRDLEAGDHPQRRRLARPGRAEHREELAVADLEVDAVDRDDSPYRLTTVLSRTAGRVSKADALSVVVVGIAKWDLDGGLGGRSWVTAGRLRLTVLRRTVPRPGGACQGCPDVVAVGAS